MTTLAETFGRIFGRDNAREQRERKLFDAVAQVREFRQELQLRNRSEDETPTRRIESARERSLAAIEELKHAAAKQ